MPSTNRQISFIGFGEAAQALTQGLNQEGQDLSIKVYDVKTLGPDANTKREEYADFSVTEAETAAEACQNVDVIFSLVTADQAEVAASDAAGGDFNGALYLDCNSCAPETKRRAAQMVEAAGGRYVDVAIMTPVHPKLHKSPCLLGGRDADAALKFSQELGMDCKIAGREVGDASMRKMIRSVMIKGLEALTIECFLAARKAGIDVDIMASLNSSYPGFDWPKRAPYMLERAVTHGTRRAAEMQEVSKTLRDLGIDPMVTDATVVRQKDAGALGLCAEEIGSDDLAALTDAMLTAQGTAGS